MRTHGRKGSARRRGFTVIASLHREEGSGPAFLSGGGEMGALIRTHDWAATPLGPPETWPQSLRTAVRLILNTGHPMYIFWGPAALCFYNDAYRQSIGPERHPGSLGQPGRAVWDEIWDAIGPQIAQVMRGDGATWHENQLLPITRGGVREDVYWTYSYGPIDDVAAPGGIGGVLVVCTETTKQVREAQRASFLSDMTQRIQPLTDPSAVMAAAVEALGTHLGAERAGYGEVLEDDITVKLDCCYANGVRPLYGAFPLDGFGPGSIERQRRGETEICDDVLAAPDQDPPVWAAIETRAFLSVPLIRDGRFVASLYVNSRNPRQWTPAEVALTEDVAARTWSAVERARSDTAQRQSEARFRAAVAAVEGVLWTNDASGRMVGDQPGWAALTGQSRDAYEGYGWSAAVHPDDAQPSIDAWNEAVTERRAFVFEHRVRRFDGEWRNFAVRAIPILDGGGAVVEWVGIHTDITDGRAADAALRQSEERFRSLFDAVDFASYAVDADWRITEFNRAAEDFFQMPRANVVGNSIWDYFPEHSGTAFEDCCRRAMTDRVASEIGAPSLLRPGRSVDLKIAPLAGAGISVSLFDVTEQRRAAARRDALIALADRTRDVGGAAEISVVASRILGEAFGVDRAGYATVDIVAETITIEGGWAAPGIDHIPGVHSFRHYGSYIEDLRRGEAVVVGDAAADPRTAATADALSAIHSRAFVNLPMIEHGAPVALIYVSSATAREWGPEDIAFIRDFATRVRNAVERAGAERGLRELNAELEARVVAQSLARGRTWQLSPDILGVLNADGYFETTNPAWKEALGWSERELAETVFFEFVHPDDLRGTQAVWDDAIERGIPALRFENRYRRKDGGYRWLSWVAVPDGGKVYCSARDIQAEKEQAEALMQAEDALRQSQKLEAMGQLTGGVAHDFNNLLTPIIGSLDLLQRRGIGGEREQRLIDGALQSAERAKVLVQRLLAFARRQPLQPAAVDVTALVRGMAELVASTSGPQVRLNVEIAPDLPPAKADANQLEMALLNLSVNARDAMSDGGMLTIAAMPERIVPGHRAGLPAGDYVRLSVADTGSGMDEATAARAIEPFFSTKGVGKGTGLGLSMVHGLASQLGGAMTIVSKPGLGTNVELWLPVSAVTADAPALATEPAPGGAKGTVLLVDDEELVRMSTADMLGDLGYAVIEARSAEEALRLVGDGAAFDMLVSDHLMPGMTGADLARELRARQPSLPVLIVSGYAEAEGIAPDLPRLTKPFRQADLAVAIAGDGR